MLFNEIYKKTVKINKSELPFPNSPMHHIIFRRLSFLITPFFILLKFSPNMISLIGLVLGLISAGLIAYGSNDSLSFGFLLYFFCLIIDFCDGNVARVTNKSTFFGRFVDGVIDIILSCAIRLALISIAFYKIQNEKLLWLGIFCAVLTPFHHLYFDRYSTFARWIKEETQINIKPYVKLQMFPRIGNILSDLQYICLFMIPFIFFDYTNYNYLCSLYFLINIFLGLFYISIHTFYSYNHMKISAKKHH